jgi:flagellar basal-body rod modification protein FlgD
MTTSIFPTTTSPTSGATNPSSSSNSSQTNINNQIAGNFNTFLQLLTTQLKNQNPLEPLDTNQFTQQLVQFAGVEQQINMNTQLQTLVSLQQTAQATQALNFVGAAVAVSGSTAPMTSHQAQWTFTPATAATATFTVTNASGQTVFTQKSVVQPGAQQFGWNGVDNNGQQWPDGNYTLTVTATDVNGQSVGVPTQINGIVDSVDLTKNPPLLSVGGQTYTVNQILRVIAPASKA